MRRSILLLALFGFTSAAPGSITNPGFDYELTGWVSRGEVSIADIGTTPPAAILDEDEIGGDITNLHQVFILDSTELIFTFAFLVESLPPERTFLPDSLLVSVLNPATGDPWLSIDGFSDVLAVEVNPAGSSGPFSIDFNTQFVHISELADLTREGLFGSAIKGGSS